MSNKIYYVKCTTLEQRDSLLAYAEWSGADDTLYRLDVKREPYVKLYKLPGGWAVCSDRSVVAGDIELTPDGFKRKIGKLWPSKVERKPSQLDRIEKRLGLIESSLAVLRSGATLMQELEEKHNIEPMNINKIREALEMAEAMADVFDQLSQKLGDLRERNADRSRLEEIREAIAELDKAAADQCKTPTLDQVVEAAFDWFDSPVDNGPGSDYDHLRARLSKLFKQ